MLLATRLVHWQLGRPGLDIRSRRRVIADPIQATQVVARDLHQRRSATAVRVNGATAWDKETGQIVNERILGNHPECSTVLQ